MKKFFYTSVAIIISIFVFNNVYYKDKARLIECSEAITQVEATQAAEYYTIWTGPKNQEWTECRMNIYSSPYYSFLRAVDANNDFICSESDWHCISVVYGTAGVCYSPKENGMCRITYCFL